MIKSVVVENYQSLKGIDIDLGPLTVVYGESNKGKSALVRALQAWAFNQAGDDFITRGEDFAAVKVELEDHSVTWMKGKTGRYVIDEGTDVERVFTKIGRGVPEEVIEVTNVREIEATDTLDIAPQFGGQFDAPFLLSSSKGQAARVLACVTNLDVILKATTICNRDLRRGRQEADILVAESAKVVDALAAFADIEERKELLASWEQTYSGIIVAEELIADASERWDRLVEVEELLDTPAQDPSKIEEVISDIADLVEVKAKYNRLVYVGNYIARLGNEINLIQGNVASLEQGLSSFRSCPTCGQILP